MSTSSSVFYENASQGAGGQGSTPYVTSPTGGSVLHSGMDVSALASSVDPLMPQSQRKKRNVTGEHAGGRGKLTLLEKHAIVHKLETDKSYRQVDAARDAGVSQAAITQMMRHKERIKEDFARGMNPNAKRIRVLNKEMQELDDKLIAFLETERLRSASNGQPVCEISIRTMWEKANEFASQLGLRENSGNGPKPWRASRGWWHRFRSRVNLEMFAVEDDPEYNVLDTSTGSAVGGSASDYDYPHVAQHHNLIDDAQAVAAAASELSAMPAVNPANVPTAEEVNLMLCQVSDFTALHRLPQSRVLVQKLIAALRKEAPADPNAAATAAASSSTASSRQIDISHLAASAGAASSTSSEMNAFSGLLPLAVSR